MTELSWLKAYIKKQIELYNHRKNLQSDGTRQYTYGCLDTYEEILRKNRRSGESVI